MHRVFGTTPYVVLIALFITSSACALQGRLLFSSLTKASEANAHPSSDSIVVRSLPLAKMDVLPPQKIDAGTLWLARAIYSETNRPREQRLVAWVVRNRVETNYLGADSYREAILEPFQFSAFNPGDPRRGYYLSLTPYSEAPGWDRALRIAYRVRRLPAAARPFPVKTRHFFSERSMPSRRHPEWALRRKLVPLDEYQIDTDRFRFYKGIS